MGENFNRQVENFNRHVSSQFDEDMREAKSRRGLAALKPPVSSKTCLADKHALSRRPSTDEEEGRFLHLLNNSQ